MAKRAALAFEIDQLQQRGKKRADIELELLALRAAATGQAAEVTTARMAAAKRLTAAVQDGLGRLAMAKARFEVELHAVPLGPDGVDSVQLLFSANPGEPPRPLVKVASGGEASRVMLAIKSVVAGSDGCVCSVFDEADAGVGGAVADAVGRLMKEVSGHRQVLCITHLPQVAAHADVHLRIEKGETRGRTRSVVKALDLGEPRTREVARMLSGVEVTREALGAAEALIRSAAHAVKSVRGRKRNQPIGRERHLP
jgi:DNA repair protein RecN (Recombination protein N)